MEVFLVGRIGFEPMKAQGQLIYSQPRLTTSLPARVPKNPNLILTNQNRIGDNISDFDLRGATIRTSESL